MGQYLSTVQTSALWLPLIALLLTLPLIFIQRRVYGEIYEYRAAIIYCFVFYFVTAWLLTVLPLPRNSAEYCELRAGAANIQLIPLVSFIDIYDYGIRKDLGFGIKGLLANRALWQIAFNTLLLLPLGLFIRKLHGLGFVKTVATAFAFSLFLEVTQVTAIWGLADCVYRIFDVDDLLTNTLGAALGWTLLPLFRWMSNPRAPEEEMWYKRRQKSQKYKKD